MADEQDSARQAAEAMEQALLKATQSVERELARIVRSGEEDLDKLARRFFQRFAEMALESVLDGAFGGAGGVRMFSGNWQHARPELHPRPST